MLVEARLARFFVFYLGYVVIPQVSAMGARLFIVASFHPQIPKGAKKMIKSATKNNPESKSQTKHFDTIIDNFINGNELLGKDQFQALSEDSMRSLLKHLSERPDKAEIYKKLKSSLDESLKK
jgi:hypothetical protein